MQQRRARLVVAEDNADVLQEMRKMLSPDFDLVATAENGLALLAAAERFKPDIVVTDISMPDLSGIDAAKKALEHGYCNAVVIFSNNDSPDIVRAALDAGARGYVLKAQGEDLIDAIYAAVQGKMFLSVNSHE